MKLWLFSAHADGGHEGLIVRAETETEARALIGKASERFRYCQELAPTGRSEVVLWMDVFDVEGSLKP